jgi:DegV family protein with EDD domain
MAHYDVALIADSTCDIPQDLIEQYGIMILPQILIWGNETLRDRVDISPLEFYQRLEREKGSALPSTTQPSPSDFQNIYQRALDKGAKEILILTVSSAMSGTYQLAKQVGDQMKAPVHVVDSKGPTMSLGWQALAAARARQRGADAAEMIEAVTRARQKLVQVVCLDTLEYLHRGGRIGNAAWLVGSILNLKPLVQIDHQVGVVEAAGRARTRQKAIEALIQRFFEQIEADKPLHVAVLHGNALQDAEAIAERIQAKYAPRELLINITGPVLGINTGPRALALCGYTETT